VQTDGCNDAQADVSYRPTCDEIWQVLLLLLLVCIPHKLIDTQVAVSPITQAH